MKMSQIAKVGTILLALAGVWLVAGAPVYSPF